MGERVSQVAYEGGESTLLGQAFSPGSSGLISPASPKASSQSSEYSGTMSETNVLFRAISPPLGSTAEGGAVRSVSRHSLADKSSGAAEMEEQQSAQHVVGTPREGDTLSGHMLCLIYRGVDRGT